MLNIPLFNLLFSNISLFKLIPSICKKNEGKNKNAHHQQQQQETPKPEEGVDPPPTTFIIAKSKYDYFKPRVEIETEEEANRVFVKELYIRGMMNKNKYSFVKIICRSVGAVI